jgi:hypothetical protein
MLYRQSVDWHTILVEAEVDVVLLEVISLANKTAASALREVSNKQVAVQRRITHKAESLVDV